MKRGILLYICITVFYLCTMAQECNIDILPRDTVLYGTTPQKILLKASDSADFYYWYEDDALMEVGWPSHWVEVYPGQTKTVKLRVGITVGDNMIENGYFEDGFTGFTVPDENLHMADSLFYGKGQYTITTNPQNVPNDLNPRSGFSLNQQTNGTNTLILTTKCPESGSHSTHVNTIYSTKVKLEENQTYVFYWSLIGSAREGTGTSSNGLAVPPYSVYINDENIGFSIFGMRHRGTYPDIETQNAFGHNADRYSFNFPDAMIHSFMKNRTEQYESTVTDSVEISLKIKEAQMQSLDKIHFVIDSLDMRKLCFAESETTITVTDSKLTIDSILSFNVCEDQMPFMFRDTVMTTSGRYTYKVETPMVDTVFTINLVVGKTYNDTIETTICDNEVYNKYGFSENREGVYVHENQTILGCDSITTLVLNVLPTDEIYVYDTIYEGMKYTDYDFNISESGTFQTYYYLGGACKTKVTLNLFVIERPKLNVYIPNAFYPESDNNNIFAYYTDYDNFYLVSFEIFNRWGTKIFSSKNKCEFWDGKYKDKLCPSGTYTYLLQYRTAYNGDDVYTKKGTVVLIR
ncbi:MAG: gliding motility-associated C-terminal domain-containing protein [Bacteroidales bacterium]|nr:gliding motility-associated C-terminal domain-containing protein [Bacteroidales bacterium]